MATLSGLLASPALAQGVVIDSASALHYQGEIIQPGQLVELASGEWIMILDVSGNMVRQAESALYGSAQAQETARQETAALALEAAFGTDRRADVGGTREQDYEACLQAALAAGDEAAEQCRRPFSDLETGPGLHVERLGHDDAYAPGAPIRLSVQASFDADLSCRIEALDDSASAMRLVIGRETADSLRLQQDTLAHVPQLGGSLVRAPQEPGDYRLRCIAIDARSASAFDPAEDHFGDLLLRDEVLVAWARLRRAPVAFADTAFTVAAR